MDGFLTGILMATAFWAFNTEMLVRVRDWGQDGWDSLRRREAARTRKKRS